MPREPTTECPVQVLEGIITTHLGTIHMHKLLIHLNGRQGCEPRTERRFFRSFLRSVFRLPHKKETEKPTQFFSVVLISMSYVKNAYISVWNPRYGWTHGQLRHTAAAVAQQQQQQRQRKGNDAGVGTLNTSTYYSLHHYRQVHNPLMFTEKPAQFFSVVLISMSYAKKTYIAVWNPRCGQTHGQLRHTAAAAAQQQQQQRQRKGNVAGVGKLSTSTYYTVYSIIGRFIIH